MSVLHVGKHIAQTVTTSDGSAIAPGTVTAVSQAPAILTVAVDAQNKVSLTAVAPGSSAVSYNAPNAIAATVLHHVVANPVPQLVVTDDGPEF